MRWPRLNWGYRRAIAHGTRTSSNPLGLPHLLDRRSLTCRAVIETPRGSLAKFTIDPETGLLQLGKLLPAGLSFPVDFGFVPSTCGGDGDALDLVLLPEAVLPAGCVVQVRLLGAIEAEQWRPGRKRVRNDRLVARLAESRDFREVEALEPSVERLCAEMIAFFQTYKKARGQHFEVLALSGPARAAELIEAASERAGR